MVGGRFQSEKEYSSPSLVVYDIGGGTDVDVCGCTCRKPLGAVPD